MDVQTGDIEINKYRLWPFMCPGQSEATLAAHPEITRCHRRTLTNCCCDSTPDGKCCYKIVFLPTRRRQDDESTIAALLTSGSISRCGTTDELPAWSGFPVEGCDNAASLLPPGLKPGRAITWISGRHRLGPRRLVDNFTARRLVLPAKDDPDSFVASARVRSAGGSYPPGFSRGLSAIYVLPTVRGCNRWAHNDASLAHDHGYRPP